jgi:hypothetical protein
MSSFLGSVQKAQHFLGERNEASYGVQTDQLGESNAELYANYYATALDKDWNTAHNELSAGLFGVLKTEADANVEAERLSLVDRIIEETDSKEQAAARIQEETEGLRFSRFANPDVQVLLGDAPNSERDRRQLDRIVSAERMVGQVQERSAEGVMATIGYFADTAVSSVIHNILGAQAELTGLGDMTFEGAGQLIDLAKEAADLIQSDIPIDMFEQEFKLILDRVAEAGVFSDANPMYYETFLTMVNEQAMGGTALIERGFQALDVGTLGLAASVRGVKMASQAPRVLTRTKGREAGVESVVEASDAGRSSAMTTEARPSVIRPADSDPPTYFTGPELEAQRLVETNNAALNAAKRLHWGNPVDPEKFESVRLAERAAIRERMKTYRRYEMDINFITDPFGNIIGRMTLGKRGKAAGTPYIDRKGAQKLATQVGGEVREIIEAGKTRYVVDKEWNIRSDNLVDPTNIAEVNTNALIEIGSTTARTTAELDAIRKQGEAIGSKAIREATRAYDKVRSKTTKKDIEHVNQMMLLLRDDPNYNYHTSRLNDKDFAEMYFSRVGESPTQQTLDYYNALSDISDTEYFINADAILKDAVNNNEVMLQLDGVFYRSKQTNLPNDELVWFDGRVVDVESLPEDISIFQIKGDAYQPGGGAPTRFVAVSKPTTRRMFHTDVMGYKPGGHRRYKDRLGFYIKQEGETKLITGKTVKRLTTFMGTRNKKEAHQVVEEFNNIIDAIESGIGGRALDDVIKANNAWNTSIEDIADFNSFLDDMNLDHARVDLAADGEMLDGTLSWAGETDVGQVFRNGWNNKARGSQPLIGFGGEELATLDPANMIQRSFASALNRHADQNYYFRAVNGWLKAAEESKAISNMDEIAGMSPKQKMYNAKIKTSNKHAVAFENERNTIKFALSNPTTTAGAEKWIMDLASDYAYEKGAKGISRTIDEGNPVGWMRGLAFNTKLGLFAPDQIYVQAAQLINSTGIASANLGAVGAMRGSLGGVPLRIALIENIPDGALQRIAKVQAGFTGLSAEDFLTLRNWMKETGRDIVDRTVIEDNNTNMVGTTAVGRTLAYGRIPFNTGEGIARAGAAVLNALERVKEYGSLGDIMTDEAIRSMIRRQDILSASMTTASAANWQRSAMAIPLQFMTYNVRMMEQLFTNRVLSGAERRRLAMTHLAVFGAAAVPTAGWLADKWEWNGGVPDDSEGIFNLLRYGALDGILTEMFDNETALSGRLGVGDGLTDFVSGFFTDQVWETLGGPSVGIGMDILSAFGSFTKNLGTGNVNLLEADVNRLARNVTSYNRAYQAWVAQRYNRVTSRSSDATLYRADGTDAMLLAMGIPLREADRLWTAYNFSKADDAHFDTHVNNLVRMSRIAGNAMKDGDLDGYAETMDDIGYFLDLLTPPEKRKALQRLNKDGVLSDSMIRTLGQKGKGDVAKRLRRMIDDSGP